jgi:serine/threonine-protein kinase RsbW
MQEIREFSLASRLESVDEAAMLADQFAKSVGLDDEFIYAVDLAVRESVANAVKHGNKFDESKDVTLTFSLVDEILSGFDVEKIPDPTDPENLLKANGRGILFMNSFMDSVEWQNAPDGGLVVKMTKRHVS